MMLGTLQWLGIRLEAKQIIGSPSNLLDQARAGGSGTLGAGKSGGN
jgi:hypothetical protein